MQKRKNVKISENLLIKNFSMLNNLLNDLGLMFKRLKNDHYESLSSFQN
jgi:hypothetical protein